MGEMSMREGYGRALAAYGAINPNVVVLDVDTSSSTLTFFASSSRTVLQHRSPSRMIDVAVGPPPWKSFANGFSALGAAGLGANPNPCGYSRTNVKRRQLCRSLDFKAADASLHYGYAIMRAMPEMTVIVPADANEAGAVPLSMAGVWWMAVPPHPVHSRRTA
jgi:transketolase